MGPHMKALNARSDFSPILAHLATFYYLYNNYQVLFWGCLQCSPTAPSQLQQMGPPMKALSPRSERIAFFAHLATSSYL